MGRWQKVLGSALIGALFAVGCGQVDEQPTTAEQLDAIVAREDQAAAPETEPVQDDPVPTPAEPEPEAVSQALCTAGDPVDGIAVPAFGQAGEVRELVLEIANDDPRTGATGPSSTPYTLTTLATDDTGTIYDWLAGSTDLSAVGFTDSAGLDGLLEDLPRERIIYRIDNSGAFAEVQNIDEVRSNIVESVELLRTIAPESELGTLDQTLALYQSLDDDAIIATFAERPRIIHRFDGMSLDEGQVLEGQSSLPNGLGGPPFPAVVTVSHLPGLDAQGCEVIEIQTVPDPVEFDRIMRESLGAALDVDTPEFEFEFDVRSTTTLQFDNGANRVRRIVSSETVAVAGDSVTESTTITDITPR